jgi:hypothetical protein
MLQVRFESTAPPPRPSAIVGLVALGLALAACQQPRFVDEGPPPVDLYADMSDRDADLAASTMQTALETAADNAAVDWSNPETGNRGRFTPVRTYQTEGGYFCRDFEEELTVAGRTEVYENNHACRAEDGIWRFHDD